MSDDVFELVGTSLHGKYRVDGVVGEGGFGVVYRGFHLSFEQAIAIKCLKVPSHFTAEARNTFLERFREEGKLLAKLAEHRSITRVYDFAVTPGPDGMAIPYLVLEWLDGRELGEVLRERRQLTESEALALLRPAVDALAFAHDLGIAHRDIKPDNLFLTRTHRGEALKVLDFGIAKVMQEGDRITQMATKTSSGFRAFTPGYASPEQINSASFGATGPWTDVHAMGLILCELVTGRPALDAESAADLYLQVTGDERPTPSARGVQATPAFEQLCRRATARDPRERLADAGALLAAMDEVAVAIDSEAAVAVAQVFEAARGVPDTAALANAPTMLPGDAAATLDDADAAPAPPAKTLIEEPAAAPDASTMASPGLAARAAPGMVATGQTPAAMPTPPVPVGAPVHAPTPVHAPVYPQASAERAPSRWGCIVAVVGMIALLPVAGWLAWEALELDVVFGEAVDGPPPDDVVEHPPADSSEGCMSYASCQQGCEANAGDDCVRLAQLYQRGTRGAPQDSKKALALFESACHENEDGDACAEAGRMLLTGDFGRMEIDNERGFGLLREGCEFEAGEACCDLGNAHELGILSPRSTKFAHSYYERACYDLHDICGCIRGATLAFTKGDDTRHGRYAQRGCQMGHRPLCIAKSNVNKGIRDKDGDSF